MSTATAIERWRSERAARMDDLFGLHADAATVQARPAAVEQLRLMLVVALAAEWQGFARDLHEDAVDRIVAAMEGQPASLATLLRVSLLSRRRLDRGNADQSALNDDFRRLGLSELWATLDERSADAARWRAVLADVMAARNAVAHGSDSQLDALDARGVTIDADTVRQWQATLDELAALLHALVTEQISTLIGEDTR